MFENKEEWKEIPGYPGYFANRNGEIASNHSRRFQNNGFHLLKKSINKDGYYGVRVMKDGKTKSEKVHRLVAYAFIPNEYNKPFVNHIDFNRSNNRVENLEWCTPKENALHSSENYSTAKSGKLFFKNNNSSGYHHIEKTKLGYYRVHICHDKKRIRKQFVSLNDALNFRDKTLKKLGYENV